MMHMLPNPVGSLGLPAPPHAVIVPMHFCMLLHAKQPENTLDHVNRQCQLQPKKRGRLEVLS